MAEENISQVDDKCCYLDDAKPMEISVETMPYSSGCLDKRQGKAQVQTRYRGNQKSSTHDLCKHGKRREDDLVIKPWKLVKKKNVEESRELGKGETLRKSLGNVSKPDKPSSLHVVAKREASGEIVKSCDGLRSKTKSITIPSGSAVVRTVKKKTNLDVKKVSRISEDKSSKEDLLKNLKNKEKEKSKIDEPVRSDDSLEKTNLDVKKVSRISENKSSKENNRLKNLKNKEKTKIGEPVKCDDSLENTLYVVESSIEKKKKKKKKKKSIKSVKSEIQQFSEKKILRGSTEKSISLLPSLSPSSVEVKESRRSDPRPISQTTSRSKTGLPEKKEIGSANLVTTSKTESKIRPKRIGLKATSFPPPTKQLMSFKKGKVLDPKPEDSTPRLIKYQRRVVHEPKLRSDVNKKKKNLKDKREIIGKMNGETKREKVVLRHRKVEAKKKLQTLFNNMIEETVNKLEEVSKVKALVGAFETVISLQDNDKTSLKKKTQSKSASSLVVEG